MEKGEDSALSPDYRRVASQQLISMKGEELGDVDRPAASKQPIATEDSEGKELVPLHHQVAS